MLGEVEEGLDVNARRGSREACRVLLEVAVQAPPESDERNGAVAEVKEGTG
jgi:hypothetical protein